MSEKQQKHPHSEPVEPIEPSEPVTTAADTGDDDGSGPKNPGGGH